MPRDAATRSQSFEGVILRVRTQKIGNLLTRDPGLSSPVENILFAHTSTCDLTQLGCIFNVLASEKALSQVVGVLSFKSESLRGAAREIRAAKLSDGRPMYHLATVRYRVDITTGKVSFLSLFIAKMRGVVVTRVRVNSMVISIEMT